MPIEQSSLSSCHRLAGVRPSLARDTGSWNSPHWRALVSKEALPRDERSSDAGQTAALERRIPHRPGIRRWGSAGLQGRKPAIQLASAGLCRPRREGYDGNWMRW